MDYLTDPFDLASKWPCPSFSDIHVLSIGRYCDGIWVLRDFAPLEGARNEYSFSTFEEVFKELNKRIKEGRD